MLRAETTATVRALRWEDRTWTYAELEAATARAAVGLAAAGVGVGDHVALMMRNCPEWLFAWLGAARSGRPAVAVNAALNGEGLRYVLDHSNPESSAKPGSKRRGTTNARLLGGLCRVRLDGVARFK